MPEVFIGVGSNVEPARHIREALADLEDRFGAIRSSRVYRNRAVGFAGDDFLNLVVALQSERSVFDIMAELADIEARRGRRRSAGKFAPRTLDLDLLVYGDDVLELEALRLPRPEILEYAFVLGPLAEVAGDRLHPVLKQSYARLWEEFDRAEHPMVAVDLGSG